MRRNFFPFFKQATLCLPDFEKCGWAFTRRLALAPLLALLLLALPSLAQDSRQVSGVVRDESGAGLPGVTVLSMADTEGENLSYTGTVGMALVWTAADVLPELMDAREEGIQSFLSALVQAAQHPVARAITYPFRIMIRPLAAHTLDEWLARLWPAFAMLALHYIWVIRADTAFEEAAAEVSLRRAQARAETVRRLVDGVAVLVADAWNGAGSACGPGPAERAELRQIAKELAAIARSGQVLPGSIAERLTSCGRPGCACQAVGCTYRELQWGHSHSSRCCGFPAFGRPSIP